MPFPTRAEAGPYFRRLADLMGLRDWQVVVEDEPPDCATTAALIRCVPGRRLAFVRLSDGLLAEGAEEQRYVACHELIHVHHALADQVAEEAMPRASVRAWTAALEHAVDGIAREYAALLPLP